MYYKVVREVDEKYLSLWVVDKAWYVEYEVGKWTYPVRKGSKLFVFESLEAALEHVYLVDGTIFACEVINPTKCEEVVRFCNGSALALYWTKGPQFLDYVSCPPKGTVLVDGVKLYANIPTIP